MKMNFLDKVSETATLEAGLQSDYSIRNFDVEYRNYDWINGIWVSDDELSNIYDMTNWVHGAFVTWEDVLGEFQYQLGLRAEYMDRLLTQKTLAEDYAYDKLDWFPSFSLARKFGEHQLQLSYSRRINRPNENLLNPFPFYSDRYLVSSGNPRLLPEYTHSLELNYQKMFGGVYVSVQTYGRFSTNTMWQSMSADSTGRMFSTFGNFAETSNIGAEISASWRPATWLRLDPNVNLFNYAVDGEAIGVRLDQQAFTWTARLSATCTFGPSTRLQATGMYLSRRIGPQSETDPMFYLSVSARQEFLDRRISLTLQAQNILRSAWVDVTTTGPNFANSFLIKPEVPIVNLTLTYNFNNYQPHPATRRRGGCWYRDVAGRTGTGWCITLPCLSDRTVMPTVAISPPPR
jgi:outer membrane receptor protein involved in Fe transport